MSAVGLMTKVEVMQRLLALVARDRRDLDVAGAFAALRQREEQGSTFLNESVAIPHARVDGLDKPEVALALTRGGVTDAGGEHSVETVFLLLAPLKGSASDLHLLTKSIRLFQSLNVRRKLLEVTAPAEVLRVLADNER